MLTWLEDYELLLWSLGVASGVMFLATLIVTPLLIVHLPADYFTRRPVWDWPTRRPAMHLLLVAAKNMLGLILFVAGLAMLVLPGQGLLTLFVAIMLLDFPRKRDLERWLIRRRPIFRAANWIRARRHQPPLELPEAKG